MSRARHTSREITAGRSLIRSALLLLVCCWLWVMQPGMSLYWLIAPEVHAEIDADLYGQTPDGRDLSDEHHRAPHDHPAQPGTPVPGAPTVNPFDAAFYIALLAPARRPALRGQRIDALVIAYTLALKPPDQPPRSL